MEKEKSAFQSKTLAQLGEGDLQRWWVRGSTKAAPFTGKPGLIDLGFPLKTYITSIHHMGETMVRTQIYLTEQE